MKENNIKKAKKRIQELREIEEEFYEEHEELDYIISIEEIEEVTQKVKMQEINKQIETISKFYKKVGANISQIEKEAYSELLEILKYVDKYYIYKTPQQIITYFQENSFSEYIQHINPQYALRNQKIGEKTKNLLAMLNVKYWAQNEERDELIKLYSINNYKEQN